MLQMDHTSISLGRDFDLFTIQLEKSTATRSIPDVPTGLSTANLVTCVHKTFGSVLPIGGCETWETVATSWVLPDILFLIWRIFAFVALLATYVYMAKVHPEELFFFSTDVFTMAVSIQALLLLQYLQVLAAEEEDELNEAGVRWLWTVLSIALQAGLTFSMVMTAMFYLSLNIYGFGRGIPALLDALPVSVLFAELLMGRVRMRISYAIFGTLATSVQVAMCVGEISTGVGPWLKALLQSKDGSMRVAAFVAVVIIHLAVGVFITVLERIRTRLGSWIEDNTKE